VSLFVGRLESRYPDIQDIIAARVELERTSFEGKSEKVIILSFLHDLKLLYRNICTLFTLDSANSQA
jgi:hypothetical protein